MWSELKFEKNFQGDIELRFAFGKGMKSEFYIITSCQHNMQAYQTGISEKFDKRKLSRDRWSSARTQAGNSAAGPSFFGTGGPDAPGGATPYDP